MLTSNLPVDENSGQGKPSLIRRAGPHQESTRSHQNENSLIFPGCSGLVGKLRWLRSLEFHKTLHRARDHSDNTSKNLRSVLRRSFALHHSAQKTRFAGGRIAPFAKECTVPA